MRATKDAKKLIRSRSSEEITIEQLAPVRTWAAANHGAVNRLAEEVRRITGEPVNRHMIGRWLRESKPIQPRFGYGMDLLEAYEKLANDE